MKYYRVSFRGRPKQYALYRRLQSLCDKAVEWLRHMGRFEQAHDLEAWMKGPGGFTRPHMPYHVTLTRHEWNILSNAIRRGMSDRSEGYSMLLRYGEWSLS